MSENEWESGEEDIDESGRNPTQQRLDEDLDNEPSPQEGEEGQEVA
jgi:hypothetical protein